jgi:hypothetical protein
MRPVQTVFLPSFGKVRTLHVLSDGEIIDSLEKYERVSERFAWVDRTTMIARILELRRLTDENRQSVVVLYEEGRRMRSFLNVEEHFNPLSPAVMAAGA